MIKEKGIIRKLDDLGRIVLPREYRKMLNIEIGDAMEIKANTEGEIIIKKVERSDEFILVAKKPAEILAESLNVTVAVSDTSSFILAVGAHGQDVKGRNLNSDIKTHIFSRMGYTSTDSAELNVLRNIMDYAYMQPVFNEDTCFGAVYIFTDMPIANAELLLRITSKFIAGNMLKL